MRKVLYALIGVVMVVGLVGYATTWPRKPKHRRLLPVRVDPRPQS